MADVNRGNRPLSPFMIGPYYRPQLTSMSSIFVRITGIAIFVLALLPIAWLLSATASEGSFAAWDGFIRSWFGDLILFGATYALFYHMLGRLRHVIWDLGYCMEVAVAEKLAIGMIVLSGILTVLVALIV